MADEIKAVQDEGLAEELRTEDDGNTYAEVKVEDVRQLEKAKENYTGSDIQVLEGLEAVRKRPGMYIATTAAAGLHHLVWEIVDNSIDEALAGYCNNIEVIINKGNSVTVKDDGRGVPVDIVAKSGLSGVETVFTVLHAGGKFGGEGGYKVSGGLHGVGASVVNALSSWVEVTVDKAGGRYFLRFENGGHPVGHLERIGDSDLHGTTVTFQPDPTIFTETTVFNYETIKNHMRQMAFLNGGIRITLTDNRGEAPVSEVFQYNGGIKEYVNYIDSNKIPVNPAPIYCSGAEEVTLVDGETKETIYAEVAMQWTDSYSGDGIYSFCNNISTKEGGTHVEGLNRALTVINNYAREVKLLEKDEAGFKLEDLREGLTAVISVKHPNPQYEGQTKTKLGNSEVRKIVSSIVSESFKQWLLENPNEAKAIVAKIRTASNAREAAKKARDAVRNKSVFEITTLPGKLADCSSRDPEVCELYIVEGNSAGGSAKEGRDRETQAILPLRGKILNVEKAREDRVWANAEIGNMITAIGAGVRENFDITKIRYNKIVIMTDADVDGDHIRILLLTFFYRFMRPLLDNGHIYIAQPPLYKIDYKGSAYYAYNDAQLDKLRKDLALKPGYPFQRYKGLGEMDASQLWETTMDPKARKMIRITVEDAADAEKVFTDLMGDEVLPRRSFISENAKFVENLDI